MQVLVARVSVLPVLWPRSTTHRLRSQVLEHYSDLGRTADALAELDVALGLAELAADQGWIRPVVDTR